MYYRYRNGDAKAVARGAQVRPAPGHLDLRHGASIDPTVGQRWFQLVVGREPRRWCSRARVCAAPAGTVVVPARAPHRRPKRSSPRHRSRPVHPNIRVELVAMLVRNCSRGSTRPPSRELTYWWTGAGRACGGACCALSSHNSQPLARTLAPRLQPNSYTFVARWPCRNRL